MYFQYQFQKHIFRYKELGMVLWLKQVLCINILLIFPLIISLRLFKVVFNVILKHCIDKLWQIQRKMHLFVNLIYLFNIYIYSLFYLGFKTSLCLSTLYSIIFLKNLERFSFHKLMCFNVIEKLKTKQ